MRSKALISLASLALALGLAGSVSAQSAAAPAAHKPGDHVRAPVTHDQVMAKAHEMFSHLDQNHDGKITAEEVAQAHAHIRAEMRDKLFDMIDGNHDGAISKAEWTAAADLMAQRREHRAGEGAPGADQHREGMRGGHGPMGHGGGHGMGGHMGGGPAAFLAHYDTNGDGVVTEQEFMAKFEAGFRRADRNGDGVINADDHQGRHGRGHEGRDAPAAEH
jgi:Ca2+-binding EF-hand superfamily protein